MSVSYFSLSLVFLWCLVVWFLTFCLVYWINPLPSIWILFAPAWTIACIPGLPLLSSPLDIVRRSKTTPFYLSTHLPCPQYTCLPFVRPCLCFWPCLSIKLAHGSARLVLSAALQIYKYKFFFCFGYCPRLYMDITDGVYWHQIAFNGGSVINKTIKHGVLTSSVNPFYPCGFFFATCT